MKGRKGGVASWVKDAGRVFKRAKQSTFVQEQELGAVHMLYIIYSYGKDRSSVSRTELECCWDPVRMAGS